MAFCLVSTTGLGAGAGTGAACDFGSNKIDFGTSVRIDKTFVLEPRGVRDRRIEEVGVSVVLDDEGLRNGLRRKNISRTSCILFLTGSKVSMSQSPNFGCQR